MGKYGLTHKYIRLHTNEVEFRQAVEDREYEEVGVIATIETRTETPDTYQFSHRTTNNDDTFLGEYNAIDDIFYFNSLEIIWGYFGWQWTDIELDEETYHGGHFYEKVVTDIYPQIDDGYRLYHIDNLTANTPSVTEVGYFDASNIVSAQNAFSKNVKYINTNNFPLLKRVTNMFNGSTGYDPPKPMIPNRELFVPEVVDASHMFDSTYCIFSTATENQISPVIHFGKVETLNNFCYNWAFKSLDGKSNRVEDCLLGLENCYNYTDFIGGTNVSGSCLTPFNFTVPYTGDEVILFDRCLRGGSYYFYGMDFICRKSWKITKSSYNSRKVTNVFPSNVFYDNNYSSKRQISGSINFHDSLDYLVEADGIFKGLQFTEEQFTNFSPQHDNRIVCWFYRCAFNFNVVFDVYDETHDVEFKCYDFTVNHYFGDFVDCDFLNHELTLNNADKINVLNLCGCQNITKLNTTLRTYNENSEVEPYDYICFYDTNFIKDTFVNISSVFTKIINFSNNKVIDFTDSDFTVYIDLRGETGTGKYSFDYIAWSNCSAMLSTPIIKSINDDNANCYLNISINAPTTNLEHFRFGEFNFKYYNSKGYTLPYSLNSIEFDNCTNLVTFDVGDNYLNWKLSYCKNLDIDTFKTSLNRQRDAYVLAGEQTDLTENQKRKIWIHRDFYNKLDSDTQALLLVKFNNVNIVEDELQTT